MLKIIPGKLHFSTYSAGYRIINLLLDSGADIQIKDKSGKSTFYYLHEKLNSELTKRSIDGGADLKIEGKV